ncbi:MAG: hypothetical protein B7Z75_04020 [Acidocella sp. 20-57-95]|nr:MAG: hypothetical protein B7Z75_04020 [Acidocella sp. 20-57-95]OYV57057.1 MAG: hypothetical protein B7Z71_12480 [Acidocella sp. 21-58-7]HQT63903.1 hypothetical protein [Acidocella sp.]
MSEEANATEAEEWRVRAETAEATLQQVKQETSEKLIRAGLKAEAIRAGMVDLDGLKLLDLSEVTLDAQGEISDAPALLSKLKHIKPWLFGGAVSSSAAAHPPRPEPPRTRHANELSHEEWLAARAALLRRR